jgi:multidrug resistance efflux pump
MTRAMKKQAVAEKSFRDRALGDNPNPLEHIDHLFKHTARRLWVGIVGLAVLMVAGVLWTVVATQALTMSGPALVVPEAGIYAVGVGQAGQVRELLVTEGDLVDRGQTLAVLDAAEGSPSVIRSPIQGRIVAEDIRPGDVLTGADPAFRIAPTSTPVGIALVPADQVSRIRVGMPASLTVNGISRSEYGVVTGKVSFISPIAVSRARLQQITGDDSLLALPQQLGALREVRITLDEADTPSGFAWSRGSGPVGTLPVGVRAHATVVVGRERIISKAFR